MAPRGGIGVNARDADTSTNIRDRIQALPDTAFSQSSTTTLTVATNTEDDFSKSRTLKISRAIKL